MAEAVEDGVKGVHQFRAPAVIQSHGQHHAGVPRRQRHAFGDVSLHLLRQLVGAADNLQADIIAVNDGQFLAQILPQQPHQEIDFGLGPAPVFHRKRVKRQRGNIQTRAGFDDGPRGFHSGAVPGDAWQMPALRPAAVAIHDDGDMPGQALRIERLRAGAPLRGWPVQVTSVAALCSSSDMADAEARSFARKLTRYPTPRNRTSTWVLYIRKVSTVPYPAQLAARRSYNPPVAAEG